MGSLLAAGLNMLRGKIQKNESTLVDGAGSSLVTMVNGLEQPLNQGSAQMNQIVGTVGKSMGNLVKSSAAEIRKGEPMGANARIAMKGEITRAAELKEDLALRQKHFAAVAATAEQASKTATEGVNALAKTVKAQALHAAKTADLIESTAEATTDAKRKVGRLVGNDNLRRAFAGAA